MCTTPLLELYKDLPHIKKLGYTIGEMAGRILLRVIVDYSIDGTDDESHAHFLTAYERPGSSGTRCRPP